MIRLRDYVNWHRSWLAILPGSSLFYDGLRIKSSPPVYDRHTCSGCHFRSCCDVLSEPGCYVRFQYGCRDLCRPVQISTFLCVWFNDVHEPIYDFPDRVVAFESNPQLSRGGDKAVALMLRLG